MSVLRPMIIPTLGLPTQVVAQPRRPRNMLQQAFYQQQIQPQQLGPQPQTNDPLLQQTTDNSVKPPPDQFLQQPMTGEYLTQQLQSYANRKAVPQLDPGFRVQSPDQELANPANFQAFYDRLSDVQSLGDSMLGAATAKAEYARQKQLMDIMSQQVQAPNGASSYKGGNNYGNPIPANPKENFKFAQDIAPQFGWDAKELQAWYTLGMKESGWNNIAQNPTSTAYGIGQFLDSTWKGVGGTKTSDPRLQVQYMAQYIKNRYGSPSAALAFHNAHNWY